MARQSKAIILDRITYRLLILPPDLQWRIRQGRVMLDELGSFGENEGARIIEASVSYGVVDEFQQVNSYDLDTQQTRRSLQLLHPAVAAVALIPTDQTVRGSRSLEGASSTGLGLAHRSRSQVQAMRQVWEPSHNDFLTQSYLQLNRANLAAPPLSFETLSPGGHAELSLQTARRRREQFPHDTGVVLCGITVLPHDEGNERSTVAFINDVVASNALNYLLLTSNRRRQGPDPEHDDMLAHLIGIGLQDARRTGANPANFLADSTIPTLTEPEDDPAPSTRLLTFEFLQERTSVEPPPPVCRLRRFFGARPELPRTSPQVLIERGELLATRLIRGEGRLAGPRPLDPGTRTSILLGLASNDEARFPEIAHAIRERLAARRIADPQRVHLIIGRLSVPVTPPDQAAPLVGMRLGQMQGPLDAILAENREVHRLAAANTNGHTRRFASEDVEVLLPEPSSIAQSEEHNNGSAAH